MLHIKWGGKGYKIAYAPKLQIHKKVNKIISIEKDEGI